MDCSTIIVSYNTFELTQEAVHSALASGSAFKHEVIVVDNASPDESARKLREAFPSEAYLNVHILDSGGNIGFSAANNLGAARASGRVLFFLNPDTVVHHDAIPQLVTFLDAHPGIGAVGPRVLNADGTDQPSVLTFFDARALVRHYLPLTALFRADARRYDPVPTSSGPVDVVKGCAIAVRRDAFDAIGGWDEAYFMYAEETELCWQLCEAGYQTYYLREPVITHFGGVASREQYVEQQVMDRRSVLHFMQRHGSPGVIALNRLAGFLGFSIRAAVFPLLARLRPADAEEYQLRGRAASALWRWFLRDYH